MPRVFFAIDLPHELKDDLAPAALSLRDLSRHVRPVGRRSFHLTLLFLGDQPPSILPDLSRIGNDAVAGARPCNLAVGPAGFFPRVSFMTLTGELDTIAVLANVLSEACVGYVERPETRPFKAHVTLARHRRNITPEEKERIRSVFSPFEGWSWVADELILFESDLTPKGAIYTALDRFPFKG